MNTTEQSTSGKLVYLRKDISCACYIFFTIYLVWELFLRDPIDWSTFPFRLVLLCAMSALSGFSCWVICFSSDYLGAQRLALAGHTLTFTPSRYSGEDSKSYDLRNYRAILYEREFFATGPGYWSSLYLVDKNGRAEPLVFRNLSVWKINMKLIDNVFKTSGLQVIKKRYALDFYLKRKEELPVE